MSKEAYKPTCQKRPIFIRIDPTYTSTHVYIYIYMYIDPAHISTRVYLYSSCIYIHACSHIHKQTNKSAHPSIVTIVSPPFSSSSPLCLPACVPPTTNHSAQHQRTLRSLSIRLHSRTSLLCIVSSRTGLIHIGGCNIPVSTSTRGCRPRTER